MTDRPTDGPTDTARCRVACPRLKSELFASDGLILPHYAKVFFLTADELSEFTLDSSFQKGRGDAEDLS